MKNKLILFAAIYSILSIVAICITFYGGYIKLLNLIYIFSLLGMLPFALMAIKSFRDKENGGIITGKEALKAGLRFVVTSAIILSLFQALFFMLDFKEYKINYMKSVGPEAIKKEIASGKIKAEESEIPKILNNDIEQVTLFAEITGTLFKTIAYGLFCSFIGAVVFKRTTVKLKVKSHKPKG